MNQWTGRCLNCDAALSAGASRLCRNCYLAQAAINKARKIQTAEANKEIREQRSVRQITNRLERQSKRLCRQSQKRKPVIRQWRRRGVFDALFRSVVFERIEAMPDSHLSPHNQLEQKEAVNNICRRLIIERGLSAIDARNLVLEYL